jgi:hypothetical protein
MRAHSLGIAENAPPMALLRMATTSTLSPVSLVEAVRL